MKGYDVISALGRQIRDNDIIISSNGNISREAYHLLPKAQVYLRGSMGLPIAVGLGLALAQPDKRVIVLTGDGNLLMGLGSAATAAYYKPDNLKILVLDNAVYFTTGGQKTVSSTIDYSLFLDSLGIADAHSRPASAEHIDKDLENFLSTGKLAALHLTIDKGKKDLKNIPWHPEEITERFLRR